MKNILSQPTSLTLSFLISCFKIAQYFKSEQFEKNYLSIKILFAMVTMVIELPNMMQVTTMTDMVCRAFASICNC